MTGPAPDTSSPGVVERAAMRSRNWLALGAVALGVSSGATALAQDANYWSTAYGTRAQLLGGVVTGSSGDISSVYYNPGALAQRRISARGLRAAVPARERRERF